MILRKTVELELVKMLPVMLTLAPVFHLQMYDIASKHSHSSLMLVLEGIETQDMVMALERHVYVDPGCQLCTLESMEVTLRDANLTIEA